MYDFQTLRFGAYEQIDLCHEQSNNTLSIIPEFGACLLALKLRGQPILDAYSTPALLQENYWGKNVLLYPFPNRLRDGLYSWQGQSFQFPLNDADTGNALHGFGMDRPMQIYMLNLGNTSASIGLRYEYLGERLHYPFPFVFNAIFSLQEPNAFEIELQVQNTGPTPMPIGFGWHPYFQMANRVEEIALQLPSAMRVEVDERLLPTGKRLPFNEFEQLRPLEDEVLDTCFALAADIPSVAEVTVKGARGILHYWQETGPGKFNFLQIFTPPHRQSIAIEPMTCNIDAFNNGEGLLLLAPGTQATARAGCRLEI
jgi:aldose 1-epimerase